MYSQLYLPKSFISKIKAQNATNEDLFIIDDNLVTPQLLILLKLRTEK